MQRSNNSTHIRFNDEIWFLLIIFIQYEGTKFQATCSINIQLKILSLAATNFPLDVIDLFEHNSIIGCLIGILFFDRKQIKRRWCEKEFKNTIFYRTMKRLVLIFCNFRAIGWFNTVLGTRILKPFNSFPRAVDIMSFVYVRECVRNLFNIIFDFY